MKIIGGLGTIVYMAGFTLGKIFPESTGLPEILANMETAEYVKNIALYYPVILSACLISGASAPEINKLANIMLKPLKYMNKQIDKLFKKYN